MKRVFIVHGWGGSPKEPMHKWLASQLRQKGYEVISPTMPNPERPEIESWVTQLKEAVGSPDKDTILVGHSVGCQTILRYLETLNPSIIIGGVVLIAPWLTLKNLEDGEQDIAKPWLETDINSAAVVKHTPRITTIFSDDDPVVPFENKELFEQKFGVESIIEHSKGHFTEDDGVTELPSALEAIEAIK